MAKISAQKRREIAEQLYIYQDMSQKEIAAYLETSEQTITRWKNKHKWEELRCAQTVTRDNILKNLYTAANEIQEVAKK